MANCTTIDSSSGNSSLEVEGQANRSVNKSSPKRAEKRYAQYTRLTLLDFARREIGKKEIPKGSNWGGDIPKYLTSVGIKFPAPWCMAEVYYVVSQYCKYMGIKNPLYKTGHVGTQYRMRPLLRVKYPKAGDIFIMLFKDGSGHCGFVEQVQGNVIFTIEGNSNNDGSANGYEVCSKVGGRQINTITGFIRVVR